MPKKTPRRGRNGLGTDFKCADCLRNTMDEYYMVNDESWSLAWSGWRRPRPPETGLERRIGRTLTRADFTDCPVNDLDDLDSGSRSPRLVNRLMRHERPSLLIFCRKGGVTVLERAPRQKTLRPVDTSTGLTRPGPC
jgi:hypothetical protein